jgi:hemolysin activation/secretion protein
MAQTAPAPSQVAPPLINPAPSAPTRILLPEVPAGAQVPAAAENLSFVLIDFDIDGEFSELVAARQALAVPLIGKRITVADVFVFADQLQQAYVRAGYPLARVVTSPQELGDRARVRIRVIDGFIERVDVEGLGGPIRRRVDAVISPLLQQRHLKQAELERRLLLAGETPGLAFNAVFAPGKEVGGSVLVLTGRYRPVSASVYIDNAMPAVFGTTQVVSSVAENGLAGFGEQLLVSAAGYPDDDFTRHHPTRRYLSSVFILPIGIDGWRAEFAATDGKTTPRVNDPIAATFGLFNQARAKLVYAAIRRRDYELSFNARFEATNERVDSLAFDIALHSDRTRVVRAGVDGIWRMRQSGTTVSGTINFSQGLNGLGARTAESAAATLVPLSRAGADASFNKLDGRLEVTQSLPQDFIATFSAFGQTSFGQPLLTSEQFDIVGSRMLSGFTAGQLPGDEAWVVRGELARPFAFPLGPVSMLVTPYIFGATGERIFKQPTALEFASVHASNYGGGARFNLPGWTEYMPDAYAFVEASRGYVNLVTAPTPRESSRVFGGVLLQY